MTVKDLTENFEGNVIIMNFETNEKEGELMQGSKLLELIGEKDVEKWETAGTKQYPKIVVHCIF